MVCVGACREESAAQTDERARVVAEEVIPRIERAVGLSFKTTPNLAVRTREEVRQYLDAKLEAELPPEEVERLTIAYRLFGLIPDTLDLPALLLELYSEQVAGYYDPDSSVLYVVEGSDPTIARMTIAHELVHALQDQYMPLDSILSMRRQNDRQIAAQCVLEGQAMLASVLAMVPNQDLEQLGTFWNDAQRRQQIREQSQRMPVFASAPMVLREGLIFPYLAGADFMRWFTRVYPDTVPFGPRLPESTEQILHPDRYRADDDPVGLEIAGADAALYTDGLGEFEIRILLTELTGSETQAAAGAMGWGGDSYAVFKRDDDHFLVWWSVWDTEEAADRFARIMDREWRKRATDGRYSLERTAVDGRPGVRFMRGSESWGLWEAPPGATVVR